MIQYEQMYLLTSYDSFHFNMIRFLFDSGSIQNESVVVSFPWKCESFRQCNTQYIIQYKQI